MRRTAVLGPIAIVLALTAALAGAATKPVTIKVGDNGFSPSTVTIATGASVDWQNVSQVEPHDVQSSTSNWSFDSGPVPPGSTSSAVTFKKAGTYGFTDAVTGAKGSVKVVASSPSPSPTHTTTSSPTPTTTHKTSTPPPSVAPSPSTSPTPAKPTPPPGLPLLITPPPGASIAAPSFAPTPLIAKPGTKATAPRALTEPPTNRGFGLPAAVAALLCVGVLSAQIRIVRAEPIPGDNDEGSVGGLQ